MKGGDFNVFIATRDDSRVQVFVRFLRHSLDLGLLG